MYHRVKYGANPSILLGTLAFYKRQPRSIYAIATATAALKILNKHKLLQIYCNGGTKYEFCSCNLIILLYIFVKIMVLI